MVQLTRCLEVGGPGLTCSQIVVYPILWLFGAPLCNPHGPRGTEQGANAGIKDETKVYIWKKGSGAPWL